MRILSENGYHSHIMAQQVGDSRTNAVKTTFSHRYYLMTEHRLLCIINIYVVNTIEIFL